MEMPGQRSEVFIKVKDLRPELGSWDVRVERPGRSARLGKILGEKTREVKCHSHHLISKGTYY